MFSHYILVTKNDLSKVHAQLEHTNSTDTLTVIVYYTIDENKVLQDVYIDQPWSTVYEQIIPLIENLADPVHIIVCYAFLIEAICPESEGEV